MRKAINGTMYDTGKGTRKIGKRTISEETLCRTKEGNFFIFRTTKDTDSVIPLDADGQTVIAVRLDAGRLDRLRWAAAQQKLSVPEYISARL